MDWSSMHEQRCMASDSGRMSGVDLAGVVVGETSRSHALIGRHGSNVGRYFPAGFACDSLDHRNFILRTSIFYLT